MRTKNTVRCVEATSFRFRVLHVPAPKNRKYLRKRNATNGIARTLGAKPQKIVFRNAEDLGPPK